MEIAVKIRNPAGRIIKRFKFKNNNFNSSILQKSEFNHTGKPFTRDSLIVLMNKEKVTEKNMTK